MDRDAQGITNTHTYSAYIYNTVHMYVYNTVLCMQYSTMHTIQYTHTYVYNTVHMYTNTVTQWLTFITIALESGLDRSSATTRSVSVTLSLTVIARRGEGGCEGWREGRL